MPRKIDASIEIETSFYSALSRMNISVEEALKEFIDNSTSSFNDHKQELEPSSGNMCKVHIEWDDESMKISDNAYGMEKEEFKRALRLSSRAEHYTETSRGQYGIGLKNAAANIGRKYKIISEQLNSSNQYYAEMDLDDLEVTKRKTVAVIINGSIPEDHGTTIIIENLLQEFNAFNKVGKKADQLDKLLIRLGKIYSKDIRAKQLEIIINGRKVEYVIPKMLKNIDTGTKYLESIDGTFKFKGDIFKYAGWIGILNTAATAEAGLTLMQHNRAIQLNYRPEELFGRSNDFRYQRVVGEIIFEGKNWNVSFAKNKFQWEDNGLEDAFIEDIKKNKEVMKLFKIARNYRKGHENITEKQIKKIDLEGTFSGLNKANPKPILSKNVDSIKLNEKPELSNELPDNDDQLIRIPYEGNEYIFHITPKQDGKMKKKWYRLEEIDKSKNEYNIHVNTRVAMFDEYTKKDEKALIVKMAVSVALAQLSSHKIGLKEIDFQLFIDQLNIILATTGKEKK